LFGYRPQASQLWEKEVPWVNADLLLVGHTHTPFVRQVGGCTIVNPGSLSQPKTGRAFACYATWEDGEILLKEYDYPVKKTIRQIRRMPLSKQDIEELAAVLKTGGLSIPGTKPSVAVCA
jgi:Calcineurin-like phosphoesterase superfamily domain